MSFLLFDFPNLIFPIFFWTVSKAKEARLRLRHGWDSWQGTWDCYKICWGEIVLKVLKLILKLSLVSLYSLIPHTGMIASWIQLFLLLSKNSVCLVYWLISCGWQMFGWSDSAAAHSAEVFQGNLCTVKWVSRVCLLFHIVYHAEVWTLDNLFLMALRAFWSKCICLCACN